MVQSGKLVERVILGIDPGTNVTGYGVIKVTGKTPVLLSVGIIDMSKLDDHYVKLKHIFEKNYQHN